MLKNYFLVAFRNFIKQRFYAYINVGGLSAGLVCVVLIYLWLNDEVKKNTFHQDVDRIFQVASNINLGDGKIATWTTTPGPLAEDIRENIVGVEKVTRALRADLLIQVGDKGLIESCMMADPEFFSIFNFKIINGKPNPIGIDKNSIAISRKIATHFFGDQNPIGKIIKRGDFDLEVKAVFEDIADNSSMKFEYVIPFEIFKESRGSGFTWINYDAATYLKLTDAANVNEVSRIINERVVAREKLAGDEHDSEFYLQPFADTYLYSLFENGKPIGGRIKYVRLFSLVAIFILIIACINSTNMATAKATTRIREIGVRKVVGAQRQSLIAQFLLESLMISLLSMILALGFVHLVLPLFNSLVSKSIEVNFFAPQFLIMTTGVVLVTALLSGTYPAFFLSSFQPADVLKGTIFASFSNASLRKSLVVFQFTLTVVLGVSALVIYRQIQYIMNKDIGYNRNGVLMFNDRINQFEAFRQEATQIPGIQVVSRGQSLIPVTNQNNHVSWPGKPDNLSIYFRTVCADYDFLETMQLKLLEGRFFSRSMSDSANFVITKKAVEVMGLKNPIGQKIKQWGIEGTVVGVVDDFHSQSLQKALDPIIFMHYAPWTDKIFVRFETEKTKEVIEKLGALHKKFNQEYPFEFTFQDDDFGKLYNNEKVIASLSIVFTVLTIIISGLGLIGLVAYTVERRKKEIGIRKVLGASATKIATMVSREFITLSFIAFAIGCPVSFYLMSEFLKGYAYHPEMSADIFLIIAIGTLTLTLITILIQVGKAAFSNPVKSLRSE